MRIAHGLETEDEIEKKDLGKDNLVCIIKNFD